MTDLEDFDYELPADRIAQEPSGRRDGSRLMLLDRASGRTEHRSFTDLPGLLSPGDLLLVNDTRVLSARLLGRRAAEGASARVEAVLAERLERLPEGGEVWTALLKGTSRPDDPIAFDGGLHGRVAGRQDDLFLLEMHAPAGTDVESALERAGTMPLPPYIRRDTPDGRDAMDRERYQTVFARVPGAVAAPTAGLHFTRELFETLGDRGVEIATITLHVGPGTFLPVRSHRVEEHRLHPERFAISRETAGRIRQARSRGGRIVAVGTTVVRTLEHRSGENGHVEPGEGSCDLFIHPGYRFRCVDALLTNFHLPRSSLLMLVSAFAGRERVLAAYREAIDRRYRFYSYGDAMLIT